MIVAEAGGSAGDVVATLGSGLVLTVTMTPGVKLEIRGGIRRRQHSRGQWGRRLAEVLPRPQVADGGGKGQRRKTGGGRIKTEGRD
jgi:hypothetical protein